METIRRYSMFIDGEWVDADERFEIRSPATEELAASAAKGAREEIFGPVLAVIRSSDTDEAIRIANDTEYGLSAGVWSSDNQRAIEVARQLEAGTIWVNDWHMVNAACPFGGYQQSGLGRELGPHAFDEHTEEKFVHIDLSGRLDRRAYPLLLSTPPD